jgi:hypothetical protein
LPENGLKSGLFVSKPAESSSVRPCDFKCPLPGEAPGIAVLDGNSYASTDHSSWYFILYDGTDNNGTVEFKFQNIPGQIQFSTLTPSTAQWSEWTNPDSWANTQDRAYLDLRFRIGADSAWQYLDSATKVEYRSEGNGTNMVDICWSASATLHLEAKDYVKDSRPVSAVPIPDSALLLGSALFGLAGLRFRRHFKSV